MEHWLAFLLIGLAGGTLSATMGVGGGVIFVPAVVLLIGFTQKEAQGTSLLALSIIGLAGALLYKYRSGIDIHPRSAMLLASGGVLGAVIGSSIAAALSGPMLRRAFGVFLIITAARMLIPSRNQAPQSNVDDAGQVDHDEATIQR